jgi:hypothetical protein
LKTRGIARTQSEKVYHPSDFIIRFLSPLIANEADRCARNGKRFDPFHPYRNVGKFFLQRQKLKIDRLGGTMPVAKRSFAPEGKG